MLSAVRSLAVHLALATLSANSLILIEIGYRGCRGPVMCTADDENDNTRLWQLNNMAPDYVVKRSLNSGQGHNLNSLDLGENEISGRWKTIELTSHVNLARVMCELLRPTVS